jgi:ubiquinone/menaquinone biosynthesis C-methylase UbiE
VKLCVSCRAPIGASAWQCATCGWLAARRDGVTIVDAGAREVSEAFSAEQFENLLTVESRHFWFAARNELIAWAVRRFFPSARTFLEVGCGTGQVLRALAETMPSLQLIGLEASFAGLQLLAERVPQIEAIQADVTSLPFDSEFDVVGAFDVLEHIPDHAAAIGEIARTVKPGGGVLLTVPQHPRLWSSLDRYSGHQRRYTRNGLTSLVQNAGLDVVFATSFVSLLLPALFLSRVTQRGDVVDPMQEFRISPAVNTLGRAMMALERRVITAGVSLPAGGSLLVVARRVSKPT